MMEIPLEYVRITRDQMLMEVARTVAMRGTCSRKQVGVVVARDGRVLVTGYNGAPAGMPHCDHICDCGYPGEGGLLFERKHFSGCLSVRVCEESVHAEANAVAFAARYGMALDGAEMFTTYAPCLACAKLVINAGITRVVMCEMYHDQSGNVLLTKAKVRTELIP